jgi:hypothetical protein
MIILNVSMLSVIMLNVIILSVIVLNVEAQFTKGRSFIIKSIFDAILQENPKMFYYLQPSLIFAVASLYGWLLALTTNIIRLG